MTETTNPNVKILHVYFGRLASLKYIYKDGREAIFQPDPFDASRSVYRTSDPVQIEEMDKEVNSGKLPFIYIDDKNPTVAEDQVDPVEAYRQMIIREHEAKKAQELASPENDRGNYGAQQLKPTGTTELGALAGGPGSGEIKRVSPLTAKILSVAGMARAGSGT